MSGILSRQAGYKHTQADSSSTWIILHSLGTLAPIVDCWINNGSSLEKIIPASVVATNNITVTVTFSVAHSGVAYVA